MHQELKGWVEFLGIKNPILTQISGNKRARRYYRIEKKSKKFLVVDASDVKESVPLFIGVGLRLKDAKVRIPLIRSFELHKGFMLLEDVGSTHLFDQCTLANPSLYYEKAIKTLVQMQKAPTQELKAMDERSLMEEMHLMVEWYLKKHLATTLECVESRIFLESFMCISKEVLAQPQEVFVHSDYHSKNLMVDSNDDIVVLDFQDAQQGPVTYDLVSLLRDAYVALDPKERKRLILLFKDLKGIEVDNETFMRWFDFTSIQRHMKLLGSFAQRSIQGRQMDSIDHTPLLIQYILDAAAQYPELDGLVSILTPEEKDSIGISF
jgi:aminoglycoside/choline kinase family phosphotransferase